MTPKQREKIEKHGKQLQSIFPRTTNLDPVDLCKQLRRIETATHRLAERWCNGEIEHEDWDRLTNKKLRQVRILTGAHLEGVPIMVNGDPRGYALKINDYWVREHPELPIERDMGGYGILAPEIT